jgi:hypothetical protein
MVVAGTAREALLTSDAAAASEETSATRLVAATVGAARHSKMKKR